MHKIGLIYVEADSLILYKLRYYSIYEKLEQGATFSDFFHKILITTWFHFWARARYDQDAWEFNLLLDDYMNLF